MASLGLDLSWWISDLPYRQVLLPLPRSPLQKKTLPLQVDEGLPVALVARLVKSRVASRVIVRQPLCSLISSFFDLGSGRVRDLGPVEEVPVVESEGLAWPTRL